MKYLLTYFKCQFFSCPKSGQADKEASPQPTRSSIGLSSHKCSQILPAYLRTLIPLPSRAKATTIQFFILSSHSSQFWTTLDIVLLFFFPESSRMWVTHFHTFSVCELLVLTYDLSIGIRSIPSPYGDHRGSLVIIILTSKSNCTIDILLYSYRTRAYNKIVSMHDLRQCWIFLRV